MGDTIVMWTVAAVCFGGGAREDAQFVLFELFPHCYAIFPTVGIVPGFIEWNFAYWTVFRFIHFLNLGCVSVLPQYRHNGLVALFSTNLR